MKIYFAGAIRGGRENSKLYENIIAYLREKGEVLTEHVGSTNLSWKGETSKEDEEIYNRDMEWLQSADILIAEVSTPSLGVGYELGIAEKLQIPILCLYRLENGKSLSAMVKGNNNLSCQEYRNLAEAQSCIGAFLQRMV